MDDGQRLLNEKIALWAGFKQSTAKWPWWTTPSGKMGDVVPPDFTRSLDAQAKWVWPKLDSIQLRSHDNGQYGCTVEHGHDIGSSSAATPALAAAQAVLKIIEGEKS